LFIGLLFRLVDDLVVISLWYDVFKHGGSLVVGFLFCRPAL